MTLRTELQKRADRWAPGGMAILSGVASVVCLVETFRRVAIGDNAGTTGFAAIAGGCLVFVIINLIDYGRA